MRSPNGTPAPPYSRTWWGPDGGDPRPHPQGSCGLLETVVPPGEGPAEARAAVPAP